MPKNFKFSNKKTAIILVAAVFLIPAFYLLLSTYHLLPTNFVLAQTFTGPNCAAGQCQGAIGVDGSNNLAVGTSSTRTGVKLLIVGSSTAPGEFAIQILNKNIGPVLLVTNDGRVSIGSISFASGSTAGGNFGNAPSSGGLFVHGPIQGDLDLKINGINLGGAASIGVGSGNLIMTGGLSVGTTTLAGAGNILMTGTISGLSVSAGSISAGTFGGVGNNLDYAFEDFVGIGTSTTVGLPAKFTVYTTSSFLGNVGVGTANPGYNLDVNGGVVRLQGASLYVQDSVPTFTTALSQSATLSRLYNNAAKDFAFGTNNSSNQLYLQSGGNVGIGTVAPSSTLHIIGDLRVSASATIPNIYDAAGNKYVTSTSGGITSLNGLSGASQTFSTSTLTTANFDIRSAGSVHTFYVPTKVNQLAGLATTTGNLIAGNSASGWQALAVGTNGKVLTASSTATNGVSWEPASGGGGGWNDDGTVVRLTTASDNVGINTVFPSSTLHVVGTITATTLSGSLAASNITAGVFGGAGNNVDFAFDDRLGVGTSSQVGLPAGFTAYETSTFYGLVGIGNCTGCGSGNMATVLNVSGTANLIDLNVIDPTNWTGGVAWGGSVDRGFLSYDAAGTVLLGGLSANSNLAIYASNTERMRILANGNVGIGTAAPGYPLDVQGSGVYQLNVKGTATGANSYTVVYLHGADTSAVGYLGLGGSTAGNASFRDTAVFGTQSNNSASINTNDTARLTVLGTGNVGIGTSTPPNPLYVKGSSVAWRSTLGIEGTAADTSIGLTLYNGPTAQTNLMGKLDYNASTKEMTLGNYNNGTGGDITLQTYAAGKNVVIPNGNVSTTSLCLSGVCNSTWPSSSGGWTDDGTSVRLTTDSDHVVIGTTTASTYALDVTGGTAANTVRVYDRTPTTGSTNLILSRGAGQSSNPILTLDANNDVVGAVQRFQSYLNTTGHVGGEIQWYQQNGNDPGVVDYIRNTYDGTYDAALTFGTRNASGTLGERMRIDYSGNVGIGTNAPGVPLEVAKDGIALAGTGVYMTRLENTAGTKGVVLGYDTASQTGLIAPLGGTSNLAFWTHDGSAWAERMRISSAGNLGIGTTNPQYGDLHVYSDANQTNETATLDLGKNVSGGYMMYQGVNQASTYGYIGMVKTGIGYGYPLVLQPNGGNVGIATTSPATKLDVAGDAWLRGEVGTGGLKVVSGGNVYIGTDAISWAYPSRLLVTETKTDTSGAPQQSVEVITSHNPGGASSITYSGVRADVAAEGAATKADMRAGWFGAYTGLSSGAVTNMYGVQGTAESLGGAVSIASGVSGVAMASSTNGKVNTAIGVIGQIVVQGSGYVTSSYAIYAANPSKTGTIVTNYGVYIESQTAGNTNYSIYIASTTTPCWYRSSGTTWTCSSDIRLKKDINDLPNAMSVINKLRPVEYHFKTEGDSSPFRYGFIAQEYQKVFPQDVSTDANGYLGISPNSVLPYLVAATQEFSTVIKVGSDGTLTLVSSDGVVKVAGDLSVSGKVAANGLELRDKATGAIYCVSITNGDLDKTKGLCD